MPFNYKNYPSNWKTEIVPFVKKRANNCCEKCGTNNYSIGFRNSTGKFQPIYGSVKHDLAGQGLSYPSSEPLTYKEAKEISDTCNELNYYENRKYIVIVLTTAHLDHNTQNNDYSNLKALCQKCHLDYDKELHVSNRKKSLNIKKGVIPLFSDF